MKHKKYILSLVLPLLISCSQNNHNFSTKWENDENYHWHVCQVEGHKDTSKREKHIWNDGEVMKEPSKTETGKNLRKSQKICKLLRYLTLHRLPQ